MPTILHITDGHIPSYANRGVLTKIFGEDGELVIREVKYKEAEERDKIKEKIKSLKDNETI